MLVLMVDGTNIEPNDDVKRLKKYTDLNVGNQSVKDWYCLTRYCQGSFEKVLDSGVIPRKYNENFLTGGMFIEHSYILNLDNNTFCHYTQSDEITEYDLDNLPNWTK